MPLKRPLQAKNIAITPEAFKNENYETYFYNEFYFAFVSQSEAFFCFFNPNIIKLNE